MSAALLRALVPARRALTETLDAPLNLTLEDESDEGRRAHLTSLKKHRDMLMVRAGRFQESHRQLLSSEVPAEGGQEVLQLAETDAELLIRFDDAITQLAGAIADCSEALSGTQVDQRSSVSADSFETSRQAVIKLPKIELKKFDGKLFHWQEFWSSFESAIHSNPSLHSVEKLIYLKSLLVGDGERAVSGLAVTGENYEIAIRMLMDRFGKKQAIIDAHYGALTDLPPASSQTRKLRQVFDIIERHLNSLEALGENVEHNHFVSLIRKKLPSEVVFHLHQAHGDAEGNVRSLRAHLRRYIESKELSECSVNEPTGEATRKNFIPPSAHKNVSPHLPPTASALFSGPARRSAPRCVYCSRNHWSDECRTFSTVEIRKKNLKDRCFVCLQSDHAARNCRNARPCFYCKGHGHHCSLCTRRFPNAPAAENAKAAMEVPSAQPEPEHTMLASGESVLMQTAKAEVQPVGKLNAVTTRILFDTGSHRSYISMQLMRELKLKPKRKERLTVFTFGCAPPREIDTVVVDVEIRLLGGGTFAFSANVVDTISGRVQRVAIDSSTFSPLHQSLHLADPPPTANERVSIDIMIGNDHYYDLVTSERIQIASGLYLIGSKLGWVLTGRHGNSNSCSTNETAEVSSLLVTGFDRPPPDLSFAPDDLVIRETVDIQKFWDLESIGIREKEKDLGDEEALKQFADTVRFQDGRYQVTWPWKDGSVCLPDNYQLALGRLRSLIRRYQDQPDVLTQYQGVLEQQLDRGVIEKVEGNHSQTTRVHYVPHHAVVTPEKSTKLRIVYDASAKCGRGDKSLNECLFRGPVILEDAGSLLLRFRMNVVGLVADIEKAFLQVGLQEEDRDVTRFLWLKDPHRLTISDNLQIFRFTRVPFGVISSPFLLGATISHHCQQMGTKVSQQVLQDIYVDNLITGVCTVKEATEFYGHVKALFQGASMNIRGWASNSAELMSALPPNDKVAGVNVKVLGYPWHLQQDTLQIHPLKLSSTPEPTKRLVLKIIASIFDPLGFLSPTVMIGKIFLQELWVRKIDWDTPLPEDCQVTWKGILESIQSTFTVSVPRFIGSLETDCFELHCFCDASQKAYGACVYIRPEADSLDSCHLVFSKGRVTPVEGMTVPRLELLAVFVGSKCLDFVARSLRSKIVAKYLWTDSQCVLHWLQSTRPLSVFIRNRVQAIKSYSHVQFRYVPSQDNPADVISRGQGAKALNAKWWHGPPWLPLDSATWPPMLPPSQISSEMTSQEAEESQHILLAPEGATAVVKANTPTLLDCTQFSSLTRLFRVMAWCLRFINLLKKVGCSRSSSLGAGEIQEAKIFWIKEVQRERYCEVLEAVRSKKSHPLIRELGIWLGKEGILRCGGRLVHANLPDSAIFPSLLPRKHHFTVLVVQDRHRKLAHSGVSHTLAQVRNEFWIPGGRSIVRKVIFDCMTCRRADGGPYRLPNVPPLPPARVTSSAPFSYTGLDYLGPLFVKDRQEAAARKVWICLFTCLAVRAIHLEVVNDLSADQFLLCIRRFIARRGKPIMITSDNAPQFKLVQTSVEKVWGRLLRDKSVQTYVGDHGIRWKFITERAPWSGGFYERLVRLVKQGLKKSLGKARLNTSQLHTLVTEIEGILNTRPLSYVGSDFDSGHVITPAHFLSLNVKFGCPGVNGNDGDPQDPTYIEKLTSQDRLIESWKKGQRLLDKFWRSWGTDYLLSLRERQPKGVKEPRCRSASQPAIGDVVLVRNDGPRGTWKIARIVNLLGSSDGEVRSAKVILPSGLIIGRSLTHLHPLEVGEEGSLPRTALGEEGSLPRTADVEVMPSQDGQESERPQRLAPKGAAIKVGQIPGLEDSASDSE